MESGPHTVTLMEQSDGTLKTVYMENMVWELANGPVPENTEIWHKNGNTLDNRLDNLYLVNNEHSAISNE
jgi:HNH endonuclease